MSSITKGSWLIGGVGGELGCTSPSLEDTFPSPEKSASAARDSKDIDATFNRPISFTFIAIILLWVLRLQHELIRTVLL